MAELFERCGMQALQADAVGFAFELGPGGEQVRIAGLPPAYAATYLRAGRASDLVVEHITETHAAASTCDLLTPAAWHSHPFYLNVASRFGLQHIMAAPIIGPNGVIGKVSAGRRGTEDAFVRSDLAAISAIAAHVSVAFASLAQESQRPAGLTARELQMVRLVAAGSTNAEIGQRLGISENTVKDALKTVFRKTGIRRRAELAALFAQWEWGRRLPN